MKPEELHPQDADRIKAARFEGPARIPLLFHVNDACWQHYPQDALQEMMSAHPLLYPDFKPFRDRYVPDFAPNARVDEPFTDPWDCVWETRENGIVGIVTHHPLEAWDAFKDYQPPDAARGDGLRPYLDSGAGRGKAEKPMNSQACNGGQPFSQPMKRGGLRHGHTFLQLCDLRGYENVIFDMTDGEPRLDLLLAMIEAFNLDLVKRDLASGAQWMEYPEDLGMQTGPLLTPGQFRKYIQPSLKRIMKPALDAGALVHMHCDGHVHALVEALLACGMHVLNLQDRVNGMEWMAAHLKGRVCIDLDLDRQEITVKGKPKEIDTWIREAVKTLATREGGLMLTYGLYPGLPLENIKAVMDAMEKYAL